MTEVDRDSEPVVRADMCQRRLGRKWFLFQRVVDVRVRERAAVIIRSVTERVNVPQPRESAWLCREPTRCPRYRLR